jgi:hypothetical protein
VDNAAGWIGSHRRWAATAIVAAILVAVGFSVASGSPSSTPLVSQSSSAPGVLAPSGLARVVVRLRQMVGRGVELYAADLTAGQAGFVYADHGRSGTFGVDAAGRVVSPAIVIALSRGSAPFPLARLEPSVPLELIARIRRMPGLEHFSRPEASLDQLDHKLGWRVYGFTATEYVGFTANPRGDGLHRFCSGRLPARLSDGVACQ